ncbi:MAG: hypothetical protein Q9217_001816 [Psora testacea]
MSTVVGFTSTDSLLRPALLPVMFAIPWFSIPKSYEQISWTMWRNLLAAEGVTRLLHYVEIALITKWTYSADGPSKPNRNVQYANKTAALAVRETKGKARMWDRLRFGLGASLNHRCNGTAVEVKNVPPFSKHDPSYAPSRSEFLRRTAMRASICYLIMDVLTSSGDPANNFQTFALDLVPVFTRLHTVTTEQVVVRTVTSVGTLFSIYCLVNLMRSVVGFFSVLLYFTDVTSWRPMFGSLGEAYSIRGFWG